MNLLKHLMGADLSKSFSKLKTKKKTINLKTIKKQR